MRLDGGRMVQERENAASTRTSPSAHDRGVEEAIAARRELDRFKREVNLIAYAASRGYLFNTKKTSTNFPALCHPTTKHKILVGKGEDGHWLYYSVNSPEAG